jgi:AsmA-like C-terminal region
MDFRAGPPSQVLQKVTVNGTVDAKQLAAAGLDAGPLLAGSASVLAALTERRNGQGEAQVSADLTDATLSAAPLGWRKPPGSPASGDLHLRLMQDRLVAVDRISLRGSQLAVEGAADYAGNRPSTLKLDRIVLGRSEAHGVVHFPATPDAAPIRATVNGPRLDLSARFAETASQGPPAQPSEAGPPWIVDAGFDQAIMGEGRVVSGLSVHAENDGRVLSRLRLDGRTGPAALFHLDIAPDRGGRKLTASASDAGELLRALDIVGSMQGGRLSVNGNYDDQQPDRPLSGTAEISDFRMRNAPAMARLLQAMTLYGLVQIARGPGLPFTRLIAPFRLTDQAIELHEARAFSSSLGVTAKGRIDRIRNVADIEGTIVPAYFFNSLLGHIPFVGKLFSPERGGGVFAASYTVHGPLDDPRVSVNPLTALTPGFLRGVFGNL